MVLGLICCLLCCSCSQKDDGEGLKEGMIPSSPQIVVGIPIQVATQQQQQMYQIGVTPTGQPIYSGGVVMMNQAQQQHQYPSAPPDYYPPPQMYTNNGH